MPDRPKSDTFRIDGSTYALDRRRGRLVNIYNDKDVIRLQDAEERLLAIAVRSDPAGKLRCLDVATALDAALGREPGSTCQSLLRDLNPMTPADNQKRIVRRRDRER